MGSVNKNEESEVGLERKTTKGREDLSAANNQKGIIAFTAIF